MRKLLVASFAVLAVTSAQAQSPLPAPPTPIPVPRPPAPAPGTIEMQPGGAPGKATAARLATMTATVTAVDLARRTVTLRQKSGETQTIPVGPEVTRLPEIAVGDLVQVDYEQRLELEYQPPGSEDVAMEGGVTAGQNDRKQLPGGVASAGVQGTVTVTAIDTGKRLVTFQAKGGKPYEVKAGPMIRLEKLKVGDRLLATYVETVAVNLRKAPPARR